MKYRTAEYSLYHAVNLGTSGALALRWIAEPDLMVRWPIGLKRASALDRPPMQVGSRIRLDFGPRRDWRATHVGEILELSENALVRRYRWDTFERTVRYALSSEGDTSVLRCSVKTRFRLCASEKSMAYIISIKSARESRHLDRSLTRLALLCQGDSRLPLLRRIRDGRLIEVAPL